MNQRNFSEFIAEKESRIAELEDALRFQRNVIIRDASGGIGEWVAVPREDFQRAREVLEEK